MHQLRSHKPWVTFDCLECGEEFQVRWAEGDDDPECGACWKRQREAEDRIAMMVEEGRAPSVSKGIHGADVTYNMMEREYGLTDMNDNMREGDIAFKGDGPKHTREMNDLIKSELELMAARANAAPVQQVPINANWGGQQQAAPDAQSNAKQAIANARGFAEQARKEGADPLAISQGWKNAPNVVDGKHQMPNTPKVMPNLKVLSRANREGNVISPVKRRT